MHCVKFTGNSQVLSARRGMSPLVSSKSIEFNANGAHLSTVAAPCPTVHASVSYTCFINIINSN